MAGNRIFVFRSTGLISACRLAAVMTAIAGTSAALGQQKPASKPPSNALQPMQPVFFDPARTPDNSAAAAEIARLTNQPGERTPPKTDTKVSVDENSIVDLHVTDEDLGTVLEMLSLQSQQNIIASKNVSARVTANLYNVTFYEALDAILSVNGYVYEQQGNFIYIYTREEWKEIEKNSKPRVSKVLRLNYLTAVDASEFVKPLLSPDGGQIKANGKTGTFPSMGDVPVGNEEYANEGVLVVYDYEENVAEIEALLKQIDTRPSQVLIEATILQTQLNEQNAFGIDFGIVADLNFSEFVGIGGPLLGPNALIGGRSSTGGSAPFPADGGGTAIGTNVGNVGGPGGLKVGVVTNNVAFFMRVLDEVTDTTILSNPKLLVLNRQSARVLVGRKVGYLNTTSTDTATTQTVEFLDTGTQLYVRPFVMGDGMIRMELKPQVSEAVIREATDATGAAVTVPDEITNELVTNVLVRDGQTIVLGGLFRESTQSTRRQVPILGDLPIIGQAFRGNDDETNRSEIIFLITPTKMNDTALDSSGQAATAYIDHARTGAREGTLFWSRDKLTAQLNIEAERLAREGDNEKAIWNVQRSLSLNPNQPEVVALREKLTGNKSQWPSRSLLNDAIRGDANKRSSQAPTPSPNFNASSTASNNAFNAPATGTFNTATTPSNTNSTAIADSNTTQETQTFTATNTNNTTDANTPTTDSQSFTTAAAPSMTTNEDSPFFPNQGTPFAGKAASGPVGLPGGFGFWSFTTAFNNNVQDRFTNVSETGTVGGK